VLERDPRPVDPEARSEAETNYRSAGHYLGQRGMPERPHARPTAIRTMRFESAPGPRDAARAVAERRAARKSIDVRETIAGVYASPQSAVLTFPVDIDPRRPRAMPAEQKKTRC